jgi:hypothetical protein
MKALILAALVALAPAHASESAMLRYSDLKAAPFDAARAASVDVDAALLTARAANKRVLIVLGGNWCNDSRAFAEHLADKAVRPLVEAQFTPVFVDVGRRDRNLDIPARWNVKTLDGTPTILVISAEGRLLNADSVSAWTRAADRSPAELAAYLQAYSTPSQTADPENPPAAD